MAQTKYLVIFVLLSLAVGFLAAAASSDEVKQVDCYSCRNCSRVDNTTKIMKCSAQCVKYVENWTDPTYGEVVNRACTSQRGSCDVIRKRYGNRLEVKLDSCMECKGDKCNNAVRSICDYTVTFISLFITPIVFKKILS